MKIGIDYGTNKNNNDNEYDDLSVNNKKQENDEYTIQEEKKSNKRVVALVSAGIVLILLGVFVINTMFSRETIQNDNELYETVDTTEISESKEVYDDNGELISSNGVYDLEGNILDKSNENLIVPGSTNYSENDNNQTTKEVYSSTDFIKDLNGVDIPAVYKVKDYNYVDDYVNYEKRRANMDSGMDLYWLDVRYNGRKYRCTVPFWRYKAMKQEGICKVRLEVLTLEGGEKVISYMNVIDDIVEE